VNVRLLVINKFKKDKRGKFKDVRGKFIFTQRVGSAWNALPEEVVEANTTAMLMTDTGIDRDTQGHTGTQRDTQGHRG